MSNVHDQVLVHGAPESGAAFSIHYRGGMSRGTHLLWEINGTEGNIEVTGATGPGQMVELSIHGANDDMSEFAPLTPPASAYNGWPDNAVALHETIDMIE